MPIRLIDVALRADLDLSTISRALRGDPRVTSATRERVCDLANQMGYRPNRTAQRLARGKTETIWCVIPGLNSPVDREPAQYAADALFDVGYDLLVVQHRNRHEVQKRLLERLSEGVADGALILPGPDIQPALEEPLVRSGFPVVFIDRHPALLGVSAQVVTTDNQAASGELCRTVVERGANRIWIGFDESNTVECERRKGAIAWLESHGVFWSDNPPDSGEMVGVLASSQAKVLSMAKSLDGKSCFAGVFDLWVGLGAPFQSVLVCKQDFKTMADEAVRLLLAQIKGEKSQTGIIRVPASVSPWIFH